MRAGLLATPEPIDCPNSTTWEKIVRFGKGKSGRDIGIFLMTELLNTSEKAGFRCNQSDLDILAIIGHRKLFRTKISSPPREI